MVAPITGSRTGANLPDPPHFFPGESVEIMPVLPIPGPDRRQRPLLTGTRWNGPKFWLLTLIDGYHRAVRFWKKGRRKSDSLAAYVPVRARPRTHCRPHCEYRKHPRLNRTG